MYVLLKIWVKIALRFYCKSITLNLDTPDGTPAILACNHPNSFLDALVIATHYPRPIHFLARGDVFRKPWIGRLLRSINMLPVYRITEGRSQLKHNEATFDACLSILKKGGTILIFSEGICQHQQSILPLKKGTARLAYRAWQEAGIPELIVRPIALAYSSFTDLPVAVAVREGATITNTFNTKGEAQFYQQFNDRLHKYLQASANANKITVKPMKRTLKTLLFLPALVGQVTHKWLYRYLKRVALRKTKGTVFYHSVLFGLLLLVYPVVLLTTTLLVMLLTGEPATLLLLVVLPACAWCYTRISHLRR